MLKRIVILNLFVCLAASASAQRFADSVVDYQSGTDFSAGYTDPTTALGEPSRATGGDFPGPVDPFSPPYLPEQMVSIGTGGSLTIGFNQPVRNDPADFFGIDFIVFGATGFNITNGDFTGGGITDGSLFNPNEGETRILVSQDNATYYELDVTLAPKFDHYFPTDGAGDFSLPLNPSLTPDDFDGLGLSGIRSLYGGSAGGTGYDIAWARDSEGNSVSLDGINYVRFEVLSGKAEIDGVSVVPEPSIPALTLLGLGGLFLWFRFHSNRSARSIRQASPHELNDRQTILLLK